MIATKSQTGQAKSKGSYVKGLDSIRFFCALWVVFFHGNMPPLLEGMDRSSKLAWIIRGIYGGAFNGPAAVIVFFVISGFCIHFPQRNSQRLRIGEFYARRSIRIGIPWLGASLAVLLLHSFGIPIGNFTEGIGWSLIAESTYYAFYPALLVARRKLGWTVLLSCAYVGCFLVIHSNTKAINYASYGPILNSLLGLPCWLLGCILAERWNRNWQPNTSKSVDIRLWRLGVWAFTDVILAARHLGLVVPRLEFIRDPWTLTLFAPIAYFWLRREIRHFQDHGAPRLFEWAGVWSYSIYLVHLVGAAMFAKLWRFNLGFILNWGVKILSIFLTCYAFYLLVERPSHKLAKSIGKRLGRQQPTDRADLVTTRGETSLAPLQGSKT